jgi:hypothetical protein
MNVGRVREVSKILLGSSYRLEVAVAVARAEPGVVHLRGLASQLDLVDSLVRVELGHFERAGLLMRLPKPRGQQQQDYERLPSAFWDLSRALLAEVRAASASPSRQADKAAQAATGQPTDQVST